MGSRRPPPARLRDAGTARWSPATRIRPSSRRCAGRPGSGSTSAPSSALAGRLGRAHRRARAERRARALHLERHRGDAARAARRARLHRPQPRAQAGRALPRLARRRACPGVALPVDRRAAQGSPPNPDLTVVDPFAEGALEAELARGDVACVILEPTGAAWGAVPLPPARVASHRRRRARARRARRLRRGRDGLPLVAGRRAGGDRRHARPQRAREGRRRRPARRRAGRARRRDGGARLPRRRAPRSSTRARTTRTRSSAVAGIATLDLLADGTALARAERRRAASCATALCAAFEERSTPGYAYGQASTFCLIFGERTRRSGDAQARRARAAR